MSPKCTRHNSHGRHDLLQPIYLALSKQRNWIARSIRIKVIDCEVLLTGTVRSDLPKQKAQESLLQSEGLGLICNQLCVMTVAQTMSAMTMSGSRRDAPRRQGLTMPCIVTDLCGFDQEDGMNVAFLVEVSDHGFIVRVVPQNRP